MDFNDTVVAHSTHAYADNFFFWSRAITAEEMFQTLSNNVIRESIAPCNVDQVDPYDCLIAHYEFHQKAGRDVFDSSPKRCSHLGRNVTENNHGLLVVSALAPIGDEAPPPPAAAAAPEMAGRRALFAGNTDLTQGANFPNNTALYASVNSSIPGQTVLIYDDEYVVRVDIGDEGVKTWTYVTVPYFKPDLSPAPRRERCAPTKVYIERMRPSGNLHVLHYDGPGMTPMEPLTHPMKCQEYFPSIIGGHIPTAGHWNSTVVGFGFARSKYVQVFDNDEYAAETRFVDVDTVEATLKAHIPHEGKLHVSNLEGFAVNHGVSTKVSAADAGADGDMSYREFSDLHVATSSLPLVRTELSMMFDGVNDFVKSELVSQKVFGNGNTGVTFSAWFMPLSDRTCERQPIVCFTDKCVCNCNLCRLVRDGGASVI